MLLAEGLVNCFELKHQRWEGYIGHPAVAFSRRFLPRSVVHQTLACTPDPWPTASDLSGLCVLTQFMTYFHSTARHHTAISGGDFLFILHQVL